VKGGTTNGPFPWESEVALPSGFGDWPALGQAQYLEMTIFLSQYLLSSQGDRVAMAHSVEGRYPFLDYRVVEFCNRLPPGLKLRGLTEKWLLRAVASRHLPDEVWRRPKRPYRAPIHTSFLGAGDDAPEYVADVLSPASLEESGIFEPAAVAQLARKGSSGRSLSEVEDMALAGILSTQLLYRQFVRDYVAGPPATHSRLKIVDHTSQEARAQ
jgi:asparagine synthase (glutamine-hydrolysing)